MLSINTNIPSLIAQRSLNNSTKLLNQAIERMTTGFKVNHASDNAACYSIISDMNVKLSSYEVAEQNVMMGIDLVNTANESLDLIGDKLTRLRALAEQAANGTYGEQSRNSINAEANSLVSEIYRILSTTEYNGKNLYGEIQLLSYSGMHDFTVNSDIKDVYTWGLRSTSDIPYSVHLDVANGIYTTLDEHAASRGYSIYYERYSNIEDFCLQIGINGDENSRLSVSTNIDLEGLYGLRGVGGADSAAYLGTIEELTNRIAAKQTELGAALNRLESAAESITVQYDNLVSSRSTLRDADVAEVSSEYIRQQILQQASATLMATANQSPGLALQLL